MQRCNPINHMVSSSPMIYILYNPTTPNHTMFCHQVLIYRQTSGNSDPESLWLLSHWKHQRSFIAKMVTVASTNSQSAILEALCWWRKELFRPRWLPRYLKKGCVALVVLLSFAAGDLTFSFLSCDITARLPCD